uniref:Uncharacterized protein n=1 Tax=Pipistrellus kuhlii TaxID=59472 RepID=A0A7J7S4Z3_PIPKU|nr:hypothetical protein mPipKuh1_010172 [Pipistrellus kuhlii]
MGSPGQTLGAWPRSPADMLSWRRSLRAPQVHEVEPGGEQLAAAGQGRQLLTLEGRRGGGSKLRASPVPGLGPTMQSYTAAGHGSRPCNKAQLCPAPLLPHTHTHTHTHVNTCMLRFPVSALSRHTPFLIFKRVKRSCLASVGQ